MEDLANVILSKLIVYGFYDPDPMNDISKDDLKYLIYDLFDENRYVEDLLENSLNVDEIVNNDELMEEILELTQEPESTFMNDIDNMMNMDYEDLLEKKISGEINL